MHRCFAVALATLALAVVGCASPSDRLCEENARCNGDADPAQSCADNKADCDADTNCSENRAKCQAENDAVSQCVLDADSACQDVGEVSFYLPPDGSACSSELDAFLTCIGAAADEP